ncbi:unnamed protein product [Adineta ricciae]|uniref:Uncharacterized protein n=1 Tax=Adineta ricciae TaxID=249248 RepID=A0A815R928_ADIRI|nr:unnamed protein product [Adineta ricciae]
MSNSDLLSSTVNWPGKGLYGLKSSVLQPTENSLVKQTIVSDHMRNHYRRMNGAKSAIDSKPPKAMVLGQKCRDRARKELAQLVYTQNMLGQLAGGSLAATPRGRSSQSASIMRRNVQSQPTTFRARSRSIGSARTMTRSLNINGSTQNLNRNVSNDGGIANKLFGGGVLSQALTAMTALGKMTSTERNKSSADVLDKHPDFFSQPDPEEHQPRLVKRDGDSFLRNNNKYYNPPSKTKSRPASAAKEQTRTQQVNVPDENKRKEDEQLALRDQLNRSMELRNNVEKKIRKAKSTTNPPLRKHSDDMLKQYGLSEQERLQYVKFMQEITDAIIRKNLTTEPAIEKLFEIHIDRNRGTLDERRLRGLLEALKEDLGVRSSRKPDTYASVNKATAFDRDPFPVRAPGTENNHILTPKTPHSDRDHSSYDINAPLPWQTTDEYDKRPSITPRTTHESKTTLSNDDYSFPSPTTTIKPKPRLSLQTKTDDHHQLDEIPSTEHNSSPPMNLNATIRKPMTDLHNVDWLTDSQPTKATSNDHVEHNKEHDEQRSPSPVPHDRSNLDTYGSNDFEDNNDNESNHSEY